MDANGTRFHLLLGRDDWAKCSTGGQPLSVLWDTSGQVEAGPTGGADVGVAWNDERDELTLRTRLFKFIAAPLDTFPDLRERRGAARDPYNNWYWIDKSRLKILVNSSGSGVTTDFWPPTGAGAAPAQGPARAGDFQAVNADKPSAPSKLSGLAVTEDHYLVAGVLDPPGLLIFDLHAGGEPRRLSWPTEVEFEPFDMAPMPGGGVWILDRTHHRYWALDRYFNVISQEQATTLLAEAHSDDFQPLAQGGKRGTQRRTFPQSISLDAATQLALKDPISIEALPDCTVLILDHDPQQKFSDIYRFDFEQQLGQPISTEVMSRLIEQNQQDDASEFTLRGYDIAFVRGNDGPDGKVLDRLYVVAEDGNQAYAFNLSQHLRQLELQPAAEYLPMRLFGGKGLVATGGGVYYDFADTWIPLVKQKRPRYVESAIILTPHFDGREPDCVWHRLMLDACIPPETKVEVWSRAANDEDELELGEWKAEPRQHLRAEGSELPFTRRKTGNDGQPPQQRANDGNGTWELLFQRARGRFLQLKLKLDGNERTSPKLRALRAYYPRFSYLNHYMPAVYREDDTSASFLDRFLANLEGFYTPLEDKIAAVQMLFDVRSAPTEVLEWLAGWFGVALDPAWDEAKRRLFIRHAMDFFQYRGTIHGLKMALHLTLDPCADETIFDSSAAAEAKRPHRFRIVEKYLTRRTPGVVFGDPTDLMGPRQISNAPQWQPQDGRTSLSQRFTDFLNSSATEKEAFVQFPLARPPVETLAAQWSQFSRATLGFEPSSATAERGYWQTFLTGSYRTIQTLNKDYGTGYDSFADVPLPADMPTGESSLKDWQKFVLDPQPSRMPIERRHWQDFLARRYHRINALNQAYGTHWTSFEVVSLPDQLPRDGAPLVDWYQFESVLMAMHRTAHRFSVLLPMPKAVTFSLEEHQRQLDLSRRIINLEKPAHTSFEVKFYWALFRLGEARLGEDTLIDQGSRAPQLMPRLILDQGFVGEGYLAPAPPEDATNRLILGRDRVAG